MPMRRLLFCSLAAALLLVASGRRAAAYPQFQFSSGTTRCSQCHFDPAGGGLITSWGRDEAGDTISLGGDGAFLHGLWQPPSWLALGADVRVAAPLVNASGGPESPQVAVFPMQSDAYVRFALGDQFSLYLQGGIRGDVGYDETFSSRLDSVSERLISNDHYLMWKPSGTGPYVRVGKFFAPFGLRFVEHIFFVQRYTGYDLYQETYNVSGGYIAEDWEAHVTAFAPPPESFPDGLQSVAPSALRQSGGVAYAEKRWNGMAMLGLQARIGTASEATTYDGGAVGKLWVEPIKMLALGEADFIHKAIPGSAGAAAAGENQFVSYLGATFFPTRGLMAGLAYERYQEDLSVQGTGRNAVDAEVNFFPWAHCEVLAIGRYQFFAPGAVADDATAKLFMLQLHYYL
ncbi:MAG TPA: hypothetical protein VHO06_06615 [Polyangia bacterium]|nr:hypothetical protein [Polyangia bacterium]